MSSSVSIEEIVDVIEHHRRRLENIEKRISKLSENIYEPKTKDEITPEDAAALFLFFTGAVAIALIVYVVYRILLFFWQPLLVILFYSTIPSLALAYTAKILEIDYLKPTLVFLAIFISIYSYTFFSHVEGDWLFSEPIIHQEGWRNLHMLGLLIAALSIALAILINRRMRS